MTLRRGIGSKPSRVDFFWRNFGVVERGERCFNGHFLVPLIEVIAKLDAPDADDRNLILNRVSHGSLLPGQY
jgi:hypothetical protein